jgi:hypothetical protein
LLAISRKLYVSLIFCHKRLSKMYWLKITYIYDFTVLCGKVQCRSYKTKTMVGAGPSFHSISPGEESISFITQVLMEISSM